MVWLYNAMGGGEMAKRIETVTNHIFAFDDDEIAIILNALAENGDDELYADIWGELPHDQYEDNPF